MGELYIKFLIIRPSRCEKERSWIDTLLLKYKSERYYKRLLEKLPYDQKEIYVMDKYGLEIELPFDSNQVKEIDKYYLEAYIRKILDIYDIPGCYLNKELNFLNERFDMEKKWLLNYLLFHDGMELFLDKYEIFKKDARFVIIDSGNKRIEMILQTILEYANYLTIITDRVEYFQKAIDVVYEETGLLMVVKSSKPNVNISGSVIINLNRNFYQYYSLFEENAYVIDLEFTNEKLSYVINRKRNLTILYDYNIFVAGEELDKELVAEVLVRDNWKVSRFSKKEDAAFSAMEAMDILKKYNISINKLVTLSKGGFRI